MVAKDALFRANDWVRVEHLLEDQKVGETSSVSYDTRDVLALSLVKLRTSLGAPILRAGPIVGQLIDVWCWRRKSTRTQPGRPKPCCGNGRLRPSDGQDKSARRATKSRAHLSRRPGVINGPSRPRLLRSGSVDNRPQEVR